MFSLQDSKMMKSESHPIRYTTRVSRCVWRDYYTQWPPKVPTTKPKICRGTGCSNDLGRMQWPLCDFEPTGSGWKRFCLMMNDILMMMNDVFVYVYILFVFWFLCFRLLDSIFPFSCRRGHPGSAVFSLFFIHAVTVSAWHICNGYGVSLLCNHWQFLLGISAMAEPNQTDRTDKKQRRKQKKNKNEMTRPNSLPLLPPWGVQSCFFGFLVSWFFVFWFLVFWFVVGGLKGWQNNTKVKDLGLTLCQFSHFRSCKRAFGWSYCLRWACGSIWKQCKKKTMEKCRYHWRKLGGLGTQIRQFCLFM